MKKPKQKAPAADKADPAITALEAKGGALGTASPPGAPKKPARTKGAKGGRPTIYTQKIGQIIAERLADGKTLTKICEDEALPCARTVRRWALDEKHPFCPLHARGRMIGYHSLSDEARDISDGTGTDPGQVARDRLKVDTRKWLLAKVLPKIYGDKLALTDPDGGAFTVRFVA